MTQEELLKQLKKKTTLYGLAGFEPTIPKAPSTPQQTLMNTPPAPSAPVPSKNTAPVLGAEYSEEDALRLNVANNRIIGQAIDRQYEKLDDYNFGEKALNDALSIAQQNSQNAWDEDLLRLQRLQNNRNDLLSYMTPVQQMQYSRVPDNKKKDYLDTIMAELQTKKGLARANEIRNMEDSTNRDLQKIALSVESGGEGFKTGLKGAYNLLRGADETVAKGASEYAFEELRPETTGALGVAMDLGNTVGNMAPSIALGLVGGPLGVGALGTAAMGVSSAGKGYDSAIGEGYTPEQAAAYGVASGVSEALLQKVAGALPGVSNAKGFVTRVLGKYGDDVILKVAKNPSLVKGLITVLGNAASEGTEEGAQEIIDTFIRNAVLGEDKDINWKDVGYSTLLGAVTGGMFAVPSGVNAYRDIQDRIKIGNEIKKDFEAFSKQLEADARRSAFEAGLNTPRLTGPTNTFYGASDGTVVGGKPYTVEDVENVLAQYEEMKKVNKQAADAWLEAELQKFAPNVPLLKRPSDFYATKNGMATKMPTPRSASPENIVEARNLYFGRSKTPEINRRFYTPVNSRQTLVDASTMPESQRTLMGLGEETPAKTETPATNEPVEPENNAISAEDEAAFMQSDSFKEWHQAFLESDRTPESAAALEKDYRERLENFVKDRKPSTSVQEVLTEQKQNKPKTKGRKRTSASVQETLLNQKTEVPAKKNETPTSTNFSSNTVGSAQYDPEGLQAKVDKYGAIPQGEGPVARVSQIPVKIDDSGKKTSRFVKTAVDAKPTTETMAGEIEQGVNKGDFRYIPTTNKELADRAAKYIEKTGFKGALEGWNYKIDNEKILTPDDIAIAEQLYNAASNAGDTKTAYKVLGDLTAYSSMYGQAIEALRILKTLGPDAKLYHLEGVKNLLNKEINLGTLKAVNKDLGVTLNEDLVNKMMNAETEEEANRYLDEIEQDMANQVKMGFYEVVQEFRYLMMLANPQTHSRNIVGNVIMQPAVKMKNIIGATLEQKIGTDRTKSVRASKEARDFAKADYKSVKDHFKEDNKYTMRNDILRKRTVFRGKLAAPLEALRKLNSKALTVEDNLFKGITYRDSLAGYMEANGHTAEYYNSPEGANDLAKAREYAMNEALKATYQDANELANILNNLERKNAVGKVVVGGLLPFKKTPLNILKRGVEYSPVGILNGIKDLKKASSNGDIKNASQAVDKLAAGLTGTGIMALGFVLRNMGVLSGSYDEDEEIARLQQAQGKQEYALNIAGNTLDLSQFSPVAMPLLVGAQLSDIVNKEGWDSAAALEALGRIADPIVDTSMLSGIGDALNTFSYGGDAGDALSSFATSSIKNYATSFVPTFGGKVARTKDPVQRSTYVDKNSEVPKTIQQILMSSKQKIPGAYSSLEPTLDIWGRETRNDSFVSRAFNNFINPSTTKPINETAVDKEVQRVYEQTGTTGVIPKKPDKYVTYKGNRKDYTAEEYTQLVKGRNGQSLLDLEVMFNDPLYSALSEEEKAEAIKDVYEYNGIKAKESIGGYSSDNDKKIDELKDAGGFTTAQAILLKQAVSNAAEGGNTLSNKTKKLQTNFIQSLDLTAEQKQVLEDTLVSDWTIIGNDTNRAYTSGKGDANSESYILSGLGKEANKAWPKLKSGGMSIGRLEEVASVMSNSAYPKKADKIKALMSEFGYNNATATYIYGAFKNK